MQLVSKVYETSYKFYGLCNLIWAPDKNGNYNFHLLATNGRTHKQTKTSKAAAAALIGSKLERNGNKQNIEF